MALITVSGHPGSGTSTLIELLEEATGWTSINGGQIFRDEAQSRGMELPEFTELCSLDPSIDTLLDQRLQDLLVAVEGPEMIESRLAGHWAARISKNTQRIWLHVDIEERAKRVLQREGGSIETIMLQIVERAKRDEKRFNDYYGISLEDMRPYTFVLDSTSITPEATCNAVLEFVNAEV